MLPQPTGSFRWVQANGRPMLGCDALGEVADHFFTTRHWSLGDRSDAHWADAWDEVARAIEIAPTHLVRVKQVHGRALVIRRSGQAISTGLETADIIVSNDPDFAIAVQAADCVPLLVADPRTRVVAAAHAGWRGLAAGVPQAAVEGLVREFGSRPEDLIAAIGPSIGACCYQVGADVRTAFHVAGFSDRHLNRWFHQQPQSSRTNPSIPGLADDRPDRWYFDCWASARDQLITAGLSAEKVSVAELCTASHSHAFCSYRRDGAPAGRMAAVIKLRT